MRFVFVFSLLLATHFLQCARILGIFPIPARSHCILGSALMKGLAEKGHDVTIITPIVDKKVPKNGTFRQIKVTGLADDFNKRRKEKNMFEEVEASIFFKLPFFVNMMHEISGETLKHSNVQKLLHSGENFDAVIVEQFMNEAHKGFATHFNAPLILFSTIGANTWVNMLVGNPAPPSYVPDALLSYSSRMNIWERSVNAFMQLYSHILYHRYAFPKHEALFNEYFPEGPSFYDTLYNASLVFLNSHPSVAHPVPFVPNMVEIGGFHVQPSQKLPEDLQKFLDDAKEGVVYFSMGSNLKSVEMPLQKRDAFLQTFAKLKLKVLWKWEDDVLPEQPKNVKLGKWLPQQDILAHPNVKLFITHGGLLSTTETVYHGVPVLAIPIAGDQKLNAQKIANEGFGLALSFGDVSEDTLTEKLQELLENPKYTQNAKQRSKIFHDRHVKPIDTAVYWVEYVIRHSGAQHLRVAGVDLPWYQYLLLDVIAMILSASLLGLYVFCKVVKFVFFCCGPDPKAKKLKKQ